MLQGNSGSELSRFARAGILIRRSALDHDGEDDRRYRSRRGSRDGRDACGTWREARCDREGACAVRRQVRTEERSCGSRGRIDARDGQAKVRPRRGARSFTATMALRPASERPYACQKSHGRRFKSEENEKHRGFWISSMTSQKRWSMFVQAIQVSGRRRLKLRRARPATACVKRGGEVEQCLPGRSRQGRARW